MSPSPIPLSQVGTVCDEIDFDQFTKTTNIGPTLAQQTADQTWAQGSKVSLTLPAGVFTRSLGRETDLHGDTGERPGAAGLAELQGRRP